MAIFENLQTALADVVENHQDTTIAFPGFWKSTNSRLVSLTSFIEYVVTPHIANLLIQEDLQISESAADAHRLRSKDVGDAFQCSNENDEELDVVSTLMNYSNLY